MTAGGSAYFDRVVDKFTDANFGPGTRICAARGSYLTYDHGFYEIKLRQLDDRGGLEGPKGRIKAARNSVRRSNYGRWSNRCRIRELQS